MYKNTTACHSVWMLCVIVFLCSVKLYWYLRGACVCVCVVNKRQALATFKLFITYSNSISFQRYLIYFFSPKKTVPQNLTYCLCKFRWKLKNKTTRNFFNCTRTTKPLSLKKSLLHNRNKSARICPLSIIQLHLKSPLSPLYIYVCGFCVQVHINIIAHKPGLCV